MSPIGIKYMAEQCGNEKLIDIHLENVRRWQTSETQIRRMLSLKEIDAKTAGDLRREIIERDLDELHQSRKNRRLPLNDEEKAKEQIAYFAYDLMFTSAAKTFEAHRLGGEDARLRRRLEENCLSLLFSR